VICDGDAESYVKTGRFWLLASFTTYSATLAWLPKLESGHAVALGRLGGEAVVHVCTCFQSFDELSRQ
jgi:hypothetical protein